MTKLRKKRLYIKNNGQQNIFTNNIWSWLCRMLQGGGFGVGKDTKISKGQKFVGRSVSV